MCNILSYFADMYWHIWSDARKIGLLSSRQNSLWSHQTLLWDNDVGGCGGKMTKATRSDDWIPFGWRTRSQTVVATVVGHCLLLSMPLGKLPTDAYYVEKYSPPPPTIDQYANASGEVLTHPLLHQSSPIFRLSLLLFLRLAHLPLHGGFAYCLS